MKPDIILYELTFKSKNPQKRGTFICYNYSAQADGSLRLQLFDINNKEEESTLYFPYGSYDRFETRLILGFKEE